MRIHRNQELEGLSRMSFVILQAVMKRLEERRKARLFAELGSSIKLPRSRPEPASRWKSSTSPTQERPPMIRIPEYAERRAVAAVARPEPRRCASSSRPTRSKVRSILGRGRPRACATAGDAPDRSMRSDSSRWRTAARARSTRSRPPAATGSSCPRTRRIRWASRSRATSCAAAIEAVVELATASGLSRVPRGADERDAMAASTFGTGQILAAAIGLGARRHRAGAGRQRHDRRRRRVYCVALGARFLDETGDELPPGGGALGSSRSVDLSDIVTRAARGDADDRLGRDQPAARRARRGSRSTDRRRAPTSSRCASSTRTWRTTRTCSKAASGRAIRERAGRRRGRWHDRGPARHRRRVRVVRHPAGRGRGDGADRLRRGPRRRRTWCSPARAGSTSRPAFGKTAAGVARRAPTPASRASASAAA